MSSFDKFTSRARDILMAAEGEARRLQHSYIGTEHLLLALVGIEDGVASAVLREMGVSLPKVRSAVESIVGSGEGASLEYISLTPRSKKVIELALDESRRLRHDYIGTEHLLLGLIREGEGIGAGVLALQGVNFKVTRIYVMRKVGGSTVTLTQEELEEVK